MAKPNWKINTIAPKANYEVPQANKKGQIPQGLMDVNNNHDDLLWFTHKEDLEYICKALNFYEFYKPLLEELKVDLKYLLENIEKGDKNKEME